MQRQPPNIDRRAVDILARTIYGEARGEGIAGKAAIANVVMNRVAVGYRGDTVEAVCKSPRQFSSWNDGDINHRIIAAMNLDDPVNREYLIIARLAVADLLKDQTFGARHYHAQAMGFPKAWGEKKEPAAKIGKHLFYNDVR